MVSYSSAEAIRDVAGATFEDLKARFLLLAQVVDMASAERKSIADEIRRREKGAAIALRIGKLTEDDKAVYRKVIDSAGVKAVKRAEA